MPLKIRGENFPEWFQIHEIRESFIPRKFPAIRYTVFYPLKTVLCYHIGPISVVFIDSTLLFISCIFSVPVVCFLHDIVL